MGGILEGFWGGFRRFWDFRGERIEQVLVAWFVSGLVSRVFAAPGLSCPCDRGKSDSAADLGRAIHKSTLRPLINNNLLHNDQVFPQGNLKEGGK